MIKENKMERIPVSYDDIEYPEITDEDYAYNILHQHRHDDEFQDWLSSFHFTTCNMTPEMRLDTFLDVMSWWL